MKQLIIFATGNKGKIREIRDISVVIEADEDKYRKEALLERLTTPERQILFRVPWVDDKGQVQVNNGYRSPLHGGLHRLP